MFGKRVRVGAVGTAAALLMSAGSAAAAVTTFENQTPIAIPATAGEAAPYPSPITVAGLAAPIEDVDVTLRGYSHTCPNDVAALVVAPNGAQSMVMADLEPGGGCPDAVDAQLTFDDSAAATPPYPPVTGTYRPADEDPLTPNPFPAPAPSGDTHPVALSAFNGTTLNGVWNLFVVDQFNTDGGSISAGWSLSIDTPDVDPPQTTITKGAPNKTEKTKFKFKFKSDEPGSTFECKADQKPYKPCTSPKTVKRLDEGKHKFKVRAIDADGNIDRSPAKDKFKVVD